MALLKFHPAIQAAIGPTEHKRILLGSWTSFGSEKGRIGARSPAVHKRQWIRTTCRRISGAFNLMLHYIKPQPRRTNADEQAVLHRHCV
ncbi:hypothetical protein O5282_26960 [Escherichia coli]|nr:hypothetical protein [Escherichia coli]